MTLLEWLKRHNKYKLNDFIELLADIQELRELVKPYWLLYNIQEVKALASELDEKEKQLRQIWKEYRLEYPLEKCLNEQLNLIIDFTKQIETAY